MKRCESQRGPYGAQAAAALEAVREQRPLVHNITNYVVMNFTANALLAMGASPIMAHALEEVEEIAAVSGAVVLNIGTLTQSWVRSMIAAGKRAGRMGKPSVFDPVGAGATELRTEASRRIIDEIAPSVIRGNASEIMALRSATKGGKGVDSAHIVDEARASAKALAAETGCVVAVTGPRDLVTDGKIHLSIDNGHPLFTKVTGTGCAATAVIGAFLAVEQNPLIATASALAFFGVAGEQAAEKTRSPGSFAVGLLDALYETTPEDLEGRANIAPADGK